jgi:hypothetical protein
MVHFFALGVTMTEIFIGHSFNMFTIIIGQTALVFVCMLLIFNIPCQGNLALAVFITFLQGFVGMCFGNFFKFLSKFHHSFKRFNNFRFTNNHYMRQRSHSSQSFTSQFYSAFSYGRDLLAHRRLIFLLTYLYFETCYLIDFDFKLLIGMPFYLRNIAYSMPVTYAIESLRSIFARGWGIERPDVYAGILISIAWIISLLVLCLVIIRSRKYTS